MQSIQKVVRGQYLLPLAFFVLTLTFALVQAITPAQAVAFSNRSLTLSNNTNVGSAATTTYTFSVQVPTGGNTGLRGVEVNFCTTPLFGSCTAPTGMSVTSSTIGTTSPVSGGTLTSNNTGTPNSALASSGTAPQVRFQWASNQTLTLPQTVTFIFNNIQNPTTAGTFFARVGFFGNGDTTYTTVTDSGVVAQSVQAATNVQFRVQEILQVCTGATTVDASGTALGNGDTCNGAGITGYQSAVNLGIADPAAVRVSPVASGGTTQGNATNGFIMVRTNATNGTTIQYRSVVNSSGFDLKVAGVNCAQNPSTSTSDFCINSAPVTQAGTSDIVAGTEEFGMNVAFVNVTAGSTSALTRDANYDGTGTTAATCTPGTGVNCWSWAGSTTATLGSASAPVDDEALILKFAAASGLTTPSGLYEANLDLFAVPTY
jgi:hypothetical protein